MWDKVKDWFWNVRFHIKDKYQTIRYWFQVNFNKYHFKTVWEAFKGFPHDHSYMWRLERAKLIEMKRYFIYSSDTFSHERDIYWINVCIKLLDILIEDDLWEYQTENGKVYKSDDVIEEHFDSLRAVFNRYVNTTNAARFTNIYDEEALGYDTFRHYIYTKKAENLYYEILKNEIYGWWD